MLHKLRSIGHHINYSVLFVALPKVLQFFFLIERSALSGKKRLEKGVGGSRNEQSVNGDHNRHRLAMVFVIRFLSLQKITFFCLSNLIFLFRDITEGRGKGRIFHLSVRWGLEKISTELNMKPVFVLARKLTERLKEGFKGCVMSLVERGRIFDSGGTETKEVKYSCIFFFKILFLQKEKMHLKNFWNKCFFLV